jgi:hypothetical protein
VKKTEFWRPKSKWILYAMEERILLSIILFGDRGREPFHLSPLFVGRFSFFKYFSFIADRGRCGRVCFGALLSFVVCNCASLLFNFVVSVHVWNSGVDKFKCYCLTRNISTVWFNSLWIFQRGGHNSQVAADWLASRMLHNFIINGFTLFVFSGY